MAWEVLAKNVRNSKVGPPFISIHKSGISFSRKACEMLSGAPFVEFLIDYEARKLAIRPLTDRTLNSYRVGSTGSRGKQAKATCAALVRRLGLVELPIRVELHTEGDLLVVVLPEARWEMFFQ